MPTFTHTVSVPWYESFKTNQVAGMFDVPAAERLTRTWEVDFPIEDKEWEIGLIVGPSGSGKSTLAKRLFGEDAYHEGFEWGDTNAIVDDFPKELTAKEITSVLSHVGFSSPPDWIKPYRVLSNGQKFRAEMARLMVGEKKLVVVDEFTSVVDRTAAQIGSFAVQKFLRARNQQDAGFKFVGVSCHYDIVNWLLPDWIYHVDTGVFEYTRGSLQRPPIEISIRRVHYSAWRVFRDHHYLSATINKSAHFYVAYIGEKPVALNAIICFPHDKVKNGWRSHRTVVLPDYQGIGIGWRMNEALAEHYIKDDGRFYQTSAHPAMIAHRRKSPKWVLTRAPSQVPGAGDKAQVSGQSLGRLTVGFEYIGERGVRLKERREREEAERLASLAKEAEA